MEQVIAGERRFPDGRPGLIPPSIASSSFRTSFASPIVVTWKTLSCKEVAGSSFFSCRHGEGHPVIGGRIHSFLAEADSYGIVVDSLDGGFRRLAEERRRLRSVAPL